MTQPEVDVTTLTQKAASDYRQELYHILFEQPELELEVNAQGSGADRKLYERKLKEVDEYLATFKEKI